MIINRVLDHVFRSRSHVAVLRTLLFTTTGFTGNAVARMAGMQPRSALAALTSLEELGIVRRQRGGRDHIFTLNRDHYLVEAGILPFFRAEQEFKENISKMLAAALRPHVISAILFGSVARKSETRASDFDVCCIVRSAEEREAARTAIHRAAPRAQRLFGVTIAPMFFTLREFQEKFTLPLIQHIVTAGETIVGTPPSRIHHDKAPSSKTRRPS